MRSLTHYYWVKKYVPNGPDVLVMSCREYKIHLSLILLFFLKQYGRKYVEGINKRNRLLKDNRKMGGGGCLSEVVGSRGGGKFHSMFFFYCYSRHV